MKKTIIQLVMDELRELERQGREPEDELMRFFGNSYQQGIRQGIQQGIEQGRLVAQKTLLETAYALLDNGVSLNVVIKSTGLSRETLEQPRH